MSQNRKLHFQKTFFFFLFSCSIALNAQQPVSTKTAEVIARLEEQIVADVEADNVGSIAAGVVMGNDLVWAKAFGWADVQNKVPADITSIYRIGSISKSVTAVLLVRLAGKGILDLDDPVSKYLPEIKNLVDSLDVAQKITLRQLASHTAGLIREPKLPKAAAGPIEKWEEKIIASIPTTSFLANPKEKYSYSNIGFGILGLTISRAANRPFIDLVHEYIFEPLGMNSSTFIISSDLKKHLTVGYANRRDSINTTFPAMEHSGRGYKVPNGGVYSTVGDLAKFIAGQTGTSLVQILSTESRAEMQRIQTPGNTNRGYGLGFSISKEEGGIQIFGHGGSVAGYNAYIAFDIKTKIGIILLRNYNRGRTRLSNYSDVVLELAKINAL